MIIDGGATGNRIGGDSLGPDGPGPDGFGEGNLISGNANVGVELSGIGTSENVVAGDLIGTLTGGINALGNGQQGVQIDSGASNNTIGGAGPAARDVISGNGWDAVHILDPGTTGNVVSGDYLGVDRLRRNPAGERVRRGGHLRRGERQPGRRGPPARATSSPPSQASACISRMTGTARQSWWKATRSAPTPPACSAGQPGGRYHPDGASDNTIGGTGPNARDMYISNYGGRDRHRLQRDHGQRGGGGLHRCHRRRCRQASQLCTAAWPSTAVPAATSSAGRQPRLGRRHLRQRHLRRVRSRTSGRTATWWKATTSAPMPPARSTRATARMA